MMDANFPGIAEYQAGDEQHDAQTSHKPNSRS